MAVITLPSKVLFEAVDKMQLLRAGVTLRSRYTGKRQSIKFPFALWIFEGKLIPMEGIDAGEWRSFLTELEGDQNTFRLPVPGVAGPLTGYSGPVPYVVPSATARSKSINVSGVTPGANVLTKGDYITVNDELKIVKNNVVADGSGQALVVFEPGLRKAITTGLMVHIYDPYIYLAAADNESASWSLQRPVRHGISIKAVEAFD